MLQDHTIRDLSHREYTYDNFIQTVKDLDKLGAEFYIGTDSQVIKKKICIVTCICAVRNGKSRVFYVKQKISRKDLKGMSMPGYIIDQTKNSSALRLRMLLEGYRSIEAAMDVQPFISKVMHIHLDVGTDSVKNKSSIALKELKNLVLSQGYECSVKPDAWAASAVADRVAKKA